VRLHISETQSRTPRGEHFSLSTSHANKIIAKPFDSFNSNASSCMTPST
jgi:hypothetical protein